MRIAKDKTVNCDVVKYNDRYYVNMFNIGFDCDVVIKTADMKKKPMIFGNTSPAWNLLRTEKEGI